MRVAVVSNPRSERNRRRGGLGDVEDCLCRFPEVLHRRFEDGADLGAIAAELARREVGLVVANGGDGTVQGLLTALLAGSAYPSPPALAVLPRGMANMTARDVGLGTRRAGALARLIEAARRDGLGPHLVRRRVLKVDHDPGRPAERGLFFGAAGICDAIRLCTGRMHRGGLKGEWSHAATVLAVLGRAAVCGPAALGIGGEEVGVRLDGGPTERGLRSVVLATTLERLVLRSRPFWGVGSGPVRFSAFAHPPEGLVRHAPRILYGREPRRLPAPTYRSAGARRVELDLARPFTIDGQFFAPAPGRPVVITAEEEVRFVRLRP
jgi:diacylglycerol kinase (ATP)